MGPPATAGETEYDKVTVPGNPPTLVKVIVDVPDAPAGKEDGETGAAEMLKSEIAVMKIASCDTEPLVAVTVKV